MSVGQDFNFVCRCLSVVGSNSYSLELPRAIISPYIMNTLLSRQVITKRRKTINYRRYCLDVFSKLSLLKFKRNIL